MEHNVYNPTEENRRRIFAVLSKPDDEFTINHKKLLRKDFQWATPDIPELNTVNPTGAFVRVWHNDEELIMNLNYVSGIEMDEIEDALSTLTGKERWSICFLISKPAISDIDDDFIKQFGNPDKKWVLQMPPRTNSWTRDWGKVEVSFILY